MNTLYQKSTYINPAVIQEYVKTLQNNKTIIVNDGHNYLFATQLFNVLELYKILDKKDIEDTKCMGEVPICLCRGYYDSSVLLQLSPNEMSIYNLLTKKFWPGDLNICVRAKSFVDPIMRYKNDYIIVHSPKNRYIQKILEKTNTPLITVLANKKGHLPLLSPTHVSEAYFNDAFPILDKSNAGTAGTTGTGRKCLDGIPHTTIMIHDNTITLIRPGSITLTDIKDTIQHSYKDPLVYIDYTPHAPITQIFTHIKPIYTFKLVDFDTNIVTPTIMQELQHSTTELLKDTILIDFNHIHVKYKDIFYGYIDISDTGQLNEFERNMFKVLHTVMKTDCNKIYITDIDFLLDKSSHLYHLIHTLAYDKRMVIPYQFIKED
tara:strand:- start:1429 stop:2559 length:1131 start_codon:yes stop_codon:yes gene_type:complete